MAIENIKLSQKERDSLIKLKRVTRIPNWNTLCRWAFCLSLADPEKPRSLRVVSDSSLEMKWKVFGGKQHRIYWALLIERCVQDGVGLTDDELYHEFRLHLNRGINRLVLDKDLKGVDALLKLAFAKRPDMESLLWQQP
jgi:DNA sulfur modification protein DndE